MWWKSQFLSLCFDSVCFYVLRNDKIEFGVNGSIFSSYIGDDEEEEEGEGGEEGEGEEKMPTCGDYIMHFLTLFWKVLFATIPPAGKMTCVII